MLFRKRTQNPEGPPASVPLPDEDAVVLPPGSGRTVIGTHTRIRGTLTGEGSIVVRGTVEGGIAIGGGLTVTASGTVQAEVEAEVDVRHGGSSHLRDRENAAQISPLAKMIPPVDTLQLIAEDE